ncbi:MAG: hypothetical protein AUG79_10455 [Gemmatimonadetes bacterium 13_1_20CM_4_69_16]|nr:MAG: hypothetical protein AUG79_10455 [Gemmatimonadetes bacterium 13_1_20CM_4_69_16]
MPRLRFVSLVVALGGAAPLAGQGVLVAPHAVYIDHARRNGTVTLYNPNPEPAEITISTAFGYPVTDSLGHFALRTVEHPDSMLPSAAEWVQAFPRRLTIASLERQTVRLLVTPPAGLPDGEYWARLIISARGGRLPIGGVGDTAAVRVQLNLVVNTNIGVAYRKGPVATGVALSNLRVRIRRDSVEVWSRLERRLTAAYVGTVRATLVDSTGKVRSTLSAPIAVYFVMEPRYALAVAGLAPGLYWLRYELVTDREDLDPAVVLQASAVRDSVELRLP